MKTILLKILIFETISFNWQEKVGHGCASEIMTIGNYCCNWKCTKARMKQNLMKTLKVSIKKWQ